MIWRALLAMLVTLAPFRAAELTDDQLRRVDGLEHRLLAPCCWSENLAEHRSETALEMKEEIRRMVADGKTDQEILDHYKARYGVRVLVEPEGSLFWIMNVVPFAVLLAGALVAVLVLRRWLRHRPVEGAPA